MLICGFNKTTLLDYPEHVAATVFLGGCNFRCPFCQNRDLVLRPAEYASFSEEEILSCLKKRASLLTGVCVSGGEPTIYPELPAFLTKLKELGYLVKLDTNGTSPAMLRQLYEAHLIDYVAMDIKSGPSDYGKVAGLEGLSSKELENTVSRTNTTEYSPVDNLLSQMEESISFLMREADPSRLTYEFRTTVVRELHDENTFAEIGRWIPGAKRYFLQSYQDNGHVLSPGFHAYTREELEAFATQLGPWIPSVSLRGID